MSKKSNKNIAAPVEDKNKKTYTHSVINFIERHGEVTKKQILDYYLRYLNSGILWNEYKENPRQFRGYACFPKTSSIWTPDSKGRFMKVRKDGKINLYSIGNINEVKINKTIAMPKAHKHN